MKDESSLLRNYEEEKRKKELTKLNRWLLLNIFLPPERLSQWITVDITDQARKTYFNVLLNNSEMSVDEIIESCHIKKNNDDADYYINLIKELYPKEWNSYKNGKDKIINVLIGKVLEYSNYTIEPNIIKEKFEHEKLN